jgi:hypothetical protein
MRQRTEKTIGQYLTYAMKAKRIIHSFSKRKTAAGLDFRESLIFGFFLPMFQGSKSLHFCKFYSFHKSTFLIGRWIFSLFRIRFSGFLIPLSGFILTRTIPWFFISPSFHRHIFSQFLKVHKLFPWVRFASICVYSWNVSHGRISPGRRFQLTWFECLPAQEILSLSTMISSLMSIPVKLVGPYHGDSYGGGGTRNAAIGWQGLKIGGCEGGRPAPWIFRRLENKLTR